MAFVKSLVNQVGRDAGKVVSNAVFKDAHSTPYRRTGGNSYSSASNNNTLSSFEKSLNFPLNTRPNTLINKISACYIEFKNQANEMVSDNYLDDEEATLLFDMVQKVTNKVGDIAEILSIDEEKNNKEIDQLTLVMEKVQTVFKQVVVVSIKGSEHRLQKYSANKGESKKISKGKYVWLHMWWMGRYARGSEKSLWKTLVMNLLIDSPYFWIVTKPVLAIQGLSTYSKARNVGENQNNALAEYETERIKVFKELQQDIQ